MGINGHVSGFGAGSAPLIPISLSNPIGNAIIDGPTIADEGAHYFSINPGTGKAVIYKTVSGIPQPATLEVGGATLSLGLRVGMAAFGHHVATEDTVPGHLHLHAHNVFDGETTVLDARIIDSYLFVADFPVQNDDTGEFTGTTFDFSYTAVGSPAFNNIKLKTGTIPAGGTIRLEAWQTTADTGPKIFDQYYPASQFPASSTIPMTAVGYLQLDEGVTYKLRLSSPTAFSFAANVAVDFPYFLADVSFTREDDMLQTVNYDWLVGDSHNFAVGEWVIESKRIYVCNTTGVQVGTFAANAALWDILGGDAVHFWNRTGTDLKPVTAGDTVTLDSSLYQPVFGDETGLVLDIPFEQYGTDTIQQDKSLSHQGVGSGGVIVSAIQGKYGSGGLFDGIDDKIDIAYDAALNTTIFTAQIRVKVTSGAGTFRSPLTSREAAPKLGYTLYANDNNIWQVLFSNGTASWRELNGPAVVLDEWVDVKISYDGTTMSLYVDDELVDSAISSYSPNTQFPTRIGAGATEGAGDFWFNCCVDHVKIYDRALSEDEIRTPYLRHGGRSVVKSDNFRVIDSNNSINFQVEPALYKYSDSSGGRMLIDVAKIQLSTGGGLMNLRDNDIEFYIASQLMLELNDIWIKLTSPDGIKSLTVNNDGVNVDSSMYQSIFGDESQLMLDIPFSHGGTDITQFNRGNRENILSGFGGVVTSSFNGPFNGPSATFNGTTAYMNNLILEGINLNAFQNLTVEGWAKSTDIITGNYMWILEGTHVSGWESFLLEPTGINQVGVFFRDGTDATGVTILATVDDVTQWHRYTVALDRDADVIEIYVDGVLKNTGSISSESAGFTQPIKLGLGALPDGSGNFWQGQQTEFRVYNKKLSLDEIRIYYARTGGDSVIQGDVFRLINLFNHVNLEVSEYLFNYSDSGTSRIFADETETKNVSPNGTNNFAVGNAGTTSTKEIIIDEALALKEITTPTAVPGYARIYPKANNELFYQDGAGTEHLLHGDAFSNLWFHSAVQDTVEISTAATFTLIDSFENIGSQDDLGNVVGDTANNDFTIGVNGAGEYKAIFHASIASAASASEMIMAIGVTLASPIDVTGATNATPIVVTSVAHGLLNGDMVTIAGATGNTAANGDWMVTSKTDDTYALINLAGANSVGNGAYNASSGNVTIKYPGNIVIHREVGFGALGVGGANGDTPLSPSDKVKLYVANVDATRDLLISIVNMEIDRIGD